ncbi:MAG: hypothetical protein Q7U99_27485 [Rubrivivax sp.]|nr:hypothetical protein [Rubrivivax sp.]
MSSKSPEPKSAQRKPMRERRAPRGTPGSVRWVQGLLGRPLGLEKRGGQLHLTLVERRRPPEVVEAEDVARLCAELRARLLDHENQHTAAVMRHLVAVHDTLLKRGWNGVQALSSKLLGKALVQAQMLASDEASRRMSDFIERLRVLQAAADVREDRVSRRGPAQTDVDVEVSETTQEEFESTERSWVATQPPELVTPDSKN